MIKKLKTFITVAVASLALAAPGIVPALASTASADITGNLCQGANGAATGSSTAGCGTAGTQGGSDIGTIASTVVNIFSIVVGVVAVIMIIYGGFRYITSGGSSENVGNAKNTIIYAIIGLVIVAIAQILVHFVLNTTTSATSGVS